MEKPWAIRDPKIDDLNFIYSSWLQGYFGASEYYRTVRRSVYDREYGKIIDSILMKADILVACQPDDPIVIYGYLVYEPKLLHYCFVKEAFRFSGIAKALVTTALGVQNVLTCTHQTRNLKEIAEKYPLLTYNPFVLFNTEKYS